MAFYVGLDQTINEPGCSAARFDVSSSHSEVENWLAIAMTALTTGKRISVQTNGCYNSAPTLDDTQNSYFFIWNGS